MSLGCVCVCCWNLCFYFMFFCMHSRILSSLFLNPFIKKFKVFFEMSTFIAFGSLTPIDWTSGWLFQSFNFKSFCVVFCLRSVDLEYDPNHVLTSQNDPKHAFRACMPKILGSLNRVHFRLTFGVAPPFWGPPRANLAKISKNGHFQDLWYTKKTGFILGYHFFVGGFICEILGWQQNSL